MRRVSPKKVESVVPQVRIWEEMSGVGWSRELGRLSCWIEGKSQVSVPLLLRGSVLKGSSERLIVSGPGNRDILGTVTQLTQLNPAFTSAPRHSGHFPSSLVAGRRRRGCHSA